MKIFLLQAVCLVLTFSSCKKQNVKPSGAISATVDGVDMNLSTSANAQLLFNADIKEYTLYVSGSTGAINANSAILIWIISPNPIINGTYLSGHGGGDDPVKITYTDRSNSKAQLYISDGSGVHPTTVTITSISSTNITGTFNGTLTYPTVKAVTNGKFDVPIEQ